MFTWPINEHLKKKNLIVSTLTETELVEDDTKERDVIHIQDLYYKIWQIYLHKNCPCLLTRGSTQVPCA